MATDNVFDFNTGKPSENTDSWDRKTLSWVTERIGDSAQNIIDSEKEIARLEDEKRQMREIGIKNVAIQNKLHAVTMGFRSRKIETIQDAVLYIEKEMTRVTFGGPSGIRIILTPIQDEKWKLIENPIAQMLADTVEMIQARFSDKDFVMTESDIVHKRKVERLALLLPLSENALKEKPTQMVPLSKNVSKENPLLPHLRRLPKDILFTKDTETSHILSQEEVWKLDANIFGKVGSALSYPISGVGEIFFLSIDSEYYQPDQDTFLIGKAVETIGLLLWYIGKNENNKNDLLTGLPLRRNFAELAHKSYEDAKEQNKEVSFVLIDADHFKNVNDSYGHAAWDLVLKTLGRLLVHKLKPADVKVRWGGEEFWILMQAAPDEATMAIQRVFDDIKKIVFQVDSSGIPSISHGTIESGFKTFSITLSAWIAGNKDQHDAVDASHNVTQLIQPSSTEQLEQLAREADKRLYEAKITGRDRIVFQSKTENQKTFWFSQLLHILRISTIKASLITWYKNSTSRNS